MTASRAVTSLNNSIDRRLTEMYAKCDKLDETLRESKQSISIMEKEEKAKWN